MPRDPVSRTANVERNGGHKWVKPLGTSPTYSHSKKTPKTITFLQISFKSLLGCSAASRSNRWWEVTKYRIEWMAFLIGSRKGPLQMIARKVAQCLAAGARAVPPRKFPPLCSPPVFPPWKVPL